MAGANHHEIVSLLKLLPKTEFAFYYNHVSRKSTANRKYTHLRLQLHSLWVVNLKFVWFANVLDFVKFGKHNKSCVFVYKQLLCIRGLTKLLQGWS